MQASRVPVIALGALCAAWAPALLAADAGTDTTALDEIVVTAQKRAEDVDKVPISISVFDAGLLDRRNIQDLNDVAAQSPGVDYQAQGTKNTLSIRGIYSGGGAATSAIYLDDVPVQVRVGIVGIIGATLPKVFDLDRVEVLRGPQGTLFGSGAEGGAIRFITPEPSLTRASGYARADLGVTADGGPSYELGAAAGAPIVAGQLAYRLSAWERHDGGYIDHASAIPGGYNQTHANWTDSQVVRAALAWAPTAALRITPSLYYQHVSTNDASTFEPASSAANTDVYTQNLSNLNPAYSDVGAGRFVNPGLLRTPSGDTLYLPAIKAVFNLDTVEFTSITSYLHRANAGNQDFSFVTPASLGLPWPQTSAAIDHNTIDTYQGIFTQDLRAQSADANEPLQWTLGLSFTRSRQRSYNPEFSPYLPTLFLNAGTDIVTALGSDLLPGGFSYLGDERSVDQQVALYGQASYRFTRQWSVTAGARVAHDSDDYSIVQSGPYNGGVTTYIAGVQGQTVKDPKVSLNLQLDDDTLVYLSAAKGDRIGGVNAPFAALGNCAPALAGLGLNGAPATFDADSLWSYELGTKARFLGGRAHVEASAFHIDWSNVQQAVFLPACSEQFIANLGKATSNGFDLQASAALTPALELGLNVGYTVAKDASTIVAGTEQFVTSGDRLNPYAAPWVIVPSVQYTVPVGGIYKAYARLDDEFHSRNTGPFAAQHAANAAYDPNFIANPSTNELNLHVGASWERWDVSGYALNALNSHPVLYNAQQEPVQAFGPAYTLRPRTLGVKAVYRW